MIYELNKEVFKSFPQLESKRLLFKEILMSNAMDLYSIRSDEEVMEFMDIPKLESLEEAQEQVKCLSNSFSEGKSIRWGIIEKSSNNFIGYYGYWRLVPEHCRGEIGYALLPQFWNKGYMSETLNVLLNFGFESIKLHSIEANVNPQNIRSIRLLEKIGFKKEAYFRENYLFNGRFLDSVIYSLLQKDLDNKILIE